MTGHRYDRTGILAVSPSAFSMLFMAPASRDTVDHGGIPVLTVSGPLEHHAGFWCDSYDAILGRASEALSSGAPGLVLRIDSPGGLVSGCMETARAIRALADASNKRLVAYVDGQACSAAYALACVAHSVVTPETGTLGSIGVLRARLDVSAALEREGVKMHVITSGARKGDGDPSVAISADEMAAIQDGVNTLSAIFFDHVAQYRNVGVDDVRALEAGVLIGQRAVNAGLADRVGTLDDALALARGEQAAAEPQQEHPMNEDEIVEALRAQAEGEDEEKAARAKRMLAAMEDEEDDPPSAEDPPEDPPPPPSDDEDAKAIALRAEATASRAERAQILATRPDLTKDALAKLQGIPTAALADALSLIPRVSVTPPKVAAPTLGKNQGGVVAGLELGARTFEPDAELDAAMGITRDAEPPIKRGATFTEFRTLTREQAAEILSKNGAPR